MQFRWYETKMLELRLQYRNDESEYWQTVPLVNYKDVPDPELDSGQVKTTQVVPPTAEPIPTPTTPVTTQRETFETSQAPDRKALEQAVADYRAKHPNIADTWQDDPASLSLDENNLLLSDEERQIAHSLTFRAFRQVNHERCKAWHAGAKPWSTADWVLAFMGEFGEACNKLKKLKRLDDGIVGNKEHEQEMHVLRREAGLEIADAFIYLDLLAIDVGIDMASYVVWKFNQTSDKVGLPQKLK